MSRVERVRSKNAGPFWLTVDVFCGSAAAYGAVHEALTTEAVAARLNQPVAPLKRFDIPSLDVIKFSFPRPVVQGGLDDRDMHGAQVAVLVEELIEELLADS